MAHDIDKPFDSEKIQYERNQLDIKILELEQTLLDLKRRRNSLSPIMQLSSDILLQVFEYIQDDGYHASLPTFPEQSSVLVSASVLPQIRTMTHVCAYWRSLTLSTRNLWAKITLWNGSKAYMAEILERSWDVPLSISFSPDPSRDYSPHAARFLEVVNTESHRIRSLNIRLTEGSQTNLLGDHGPVLRLCGTPALEELCSNDPSRDLYDFTGKILIDLVTFSSDTLRFLKVSLIHNGYDDVKSAIVCPKLSSVHLSGFASPTVELLSKLSFPPSCTISLRLFGYYASYASLGPCFHKICQSKASAGSPFKRLNLHRNEFRDENNVEVELICITLSSGLQRDPDLSMTIFLDKEIDSPASLSILRNIVSGSTLSQITSITMTDGLNLPMILWWFLSGKLHNIDSLALHKVDNVLPLLLALEPNPFIGDASAVGQFLNLRKLELRGVSFDKESRDKLHHVLKARNDAGIPLNRLIMDDVDFGLQQNEEEYLRSIQAFVQEEIKYSR